MDGSGKSTQAQMLKKWIEENLSVPAHVVREPGGCEQSELIRQHLKSGTPLDPYTQLMLFSMARYFVIENVILPYLERGHYVIMDRFIGSTNAYQYRTGGVTYKEFLDTTTKICPKALSLEKEGLTFYIEVPLETALQRIRERNGENPSVDPFENEKFLEKVKAGYDLLYKTYALPRHICINGDMAPGAVFDSVVTEFQKNVQHVSEH